jgi:hypothetical protein
VRFSVFRNSIEIEGSKRIEMLTFCFHTTDFSLYIGPEAENTPGLLNSAVDYVKIRAFSMPTSLLLGVIQAACLGAKDSVTPLIAIVYSTVVNIFGDFILVKKLGMGLRGAAIATLLAQVRFHIRTSSVSKYHHDVLNLIFYNHFSGQPLPHC